MIMLAQNVPWWESVRHEFREGEASPEAIAAVTIILSLIAALVVVQRLQAMFAARKAESDPQKLFRTIIKRLQLGVMQRDLLRRMVRDLRIEHPTGLLLCPDLFHESAERWLKNRSMGDPPPSKTQAHDIEEIAAALFGSSQAVASLLVGGAAIGASPAALP